MIDCRDVLVMDSDRSVREVICRILRSQGYSASACASEAEALEAAGQKRFDGFVLECSRRDGVPLITDIVKQRHPGAMVVAIAGEDIGRSSFDAGYTVLPKPVLPEQLLSALNGGQ